MTLSTYYLFFLLGIFCPISVFTFEIHLKNTESAVCAIVKLSEMILTVKPTMPPLEDKTIKPVEYKISVDSKDVKLVESLSSCYSDTDGAGRVAFESMKNTFVVHFVKGEKNATHPISMVVSRFVVIVKDTGHDDLKPVKPSLPPTLTFVVKDISLAKGFTSYSCFKTFNYSMHNQTWPDYKVDTFKHAVQLTVKDIHFQLNSTAIVTPKDYNCSVKPDEQKSMVIPIAVGASLASLLMIILIILIVIKKRGRRAEYDPLVNNN